MYSPEGSFTIELDVHCFLWPCSKHGLDPQLPPKIQVKGNLSKNGSTSYSYRLPIVLWEAETG